MKKDNRVLKIALATALICSIVLLKSEALAVTNNDGSVSSAFLPTIPNKAPAPSPAPEGMVWIPGGEFSMGSEGKCNGVSCCSPATVADALPVHRVYVDGFWMDATDVTDEQFEKFVKATGYVTVA